jgi:competence protein ComEA
MRSLLVLLTTLLAFTVPQPADAAAPAAPTAASAPSAALIDLNSASLDELQALKGIGDVRAAAIVKGRPYARKDELVRRGILPESVYLEIRDRVVARQR